MNVSLPSGLQRPSTPIEQPDIVASNLIKINLPYQVESIAVGTTQIGPGIAYVHNGTFHFRNPVNQTQYQISFEAGSVFYKTLIGVDMDNDNLTEFLFLQKMETITQLVLVNCDNNTVKIYNFTVIQPQEIITGDFDGDGYPEVGVYNQVRIETKDLQSGDNIGFYAPSGVINRALTGNFTADNVDEIAILRTEIFASPTMYIDIISGDCTLNRTTLFGYQSYKGTDAIRYTGNDSLDCIAVTSRKGKEIDASANLKCLYANLTEVFSMDLSEYTCDLYAKRGNFLEDAVDDIALVPSMGGQVMTISGLDGVVVAHSNDIFPPSDRFRFAIATLDADSFDDIALEGPNGLMSFIRGHTGETGYEEPQTAGPFGQLLTYDINLDGRGDIVMLSDHIAVLLSDTERPNVTIDPLFPAHPTVLDGYLKIEATAIDESGVAQAVITIFDKNWIGGPGYVGHTMTTAPNNKYFYFITGLEAGPIYYYIEFVDPYLNSYYYGNSTHPKVINVEGHFAFGSDINSTISDARRHVFDHINSTSGNDAFLAIQIDRTAGAAKIHVLASNGTSLGQLDITDAGVDENFEIYSANLDNDNIRDFLVVGFNETLTRLWLFNGSDRTSWKNATFSFGPQSDHDTLWIFDDDGDNLDEIHLISGNNTISRLQRIESDLQGWTNTSLPSNTVVISATWTELTGNHPQLALLVKNQSVIIYQADTLTELKTLNYVSLGGTNDDEPVEILPFENASLSSGELVAIYHGWMNETQTNYICFVDNNTVNVGDHAFQKIGDHVTHTIPYDSDTNGVDELFFYDTGGNVSKYLPQGPGTEEWSTFVSESECIDALVLDFDGDAQAELVVSTSDQKLSAFSLDGTLDYQETVGLIYNMYQVESVDIGAGADIMTYPALQAEYTLGAVRDIQLLYSLNVTFSIDTNSVLQGETIYPSARVQNVFGEPVSDASVAITVQYVEKGDIQEQTVGLVYDENDANYSASVSSNWPIGSVNMTLTVGHSVYSDQQQDFADILKVYSPLTLSTFFESEIDQTENLTVQVSVTDSLGNPVHGATVTIELNGSLYVAQKSGEFYTTVIQNITLAPGEHELITKAEHPFATNEVNQSNTLTVIAKSLTIVRSSPSLVEQEQQFLTWLNISDNYGHPLTNASIEADYGYDSYFLDEIVPGCYLLNDSANLPIGNYSIVIYVDHPYVQWGAYGTYYMGVWGTLDPATSYSEQVEGGTNFTVSVFVYDAYGSTPDGTWAKIEINGENYTAVLKSGGEFRANVTADFPVGEQSFKIYTGATMANETSLICDLYVSSAAQLHLSSSAGWVIAQGNSTILTVNLTDWSGTPVSDAILSTLSPEQIAFTNEGGGIYTAELKTTGYAPGEYTILISVIHAYLVGGPFGQNLTIMGEAIISLSYDSPVEIGQTTRFTISVTDPYSNPINSFNWSFTFQDVNLTGTHNGNNTFTISVPIKGPPHPTHLSVMIESETIERVNKQFTVPVRTDVHVGIASPLGASIFIQGKDQIPFVVTVADALNNSLPGITANIIIHDTTFSLTDLENGTYTGMLSTAGWSPGTYLYTLSLVHHYINYNQPFTGNITILGQLVLDIKVTPEEPLQGDNLTITIVATDIYGDPFTDLHLAIMFENQSINATETQTAGIYVATLNVSGVGHGYSDITVIAVGDLCQPAKSTKSIFIGVRPPDVTMNVPTFTFGVGVSFLVSLLGLFIYFRTASSLHVGKKALARVHTTIRHMDQLYLGVAGGGALVLLHSFVLADGGQYGLAVAESILLLGISILLYGLWLYRDAVSAILQTEMISRRRVLLGLWHLFFVPVVVIQIFLWGEHIEWFQFYVLQETFAVGPVLVPTIMLTIFATYVSSIVLVVINSYRELRKGLRKLSHMQKSGTPPAIVEEERIELVNKTGASIRIKFFMFLVVLAGTTVSTMDFLRSYSLGVIVLMPVLFLIVIPYLSSKLLKATNRAVRYIRHSDTGSSDIQTIVDESTVLESETLKEEESPTKESPDKEEEEVSTIDEINAEEEEEERLDR